LMESCWLLGQLSEPRFKFRWWWIVKKNGLHLWTRVPVYIAACHAPPIAPTRHCVRKRIDRASVMWADVVNGMEFSTSGRLARKAPIRVFHSAVDYKLADLGAINTP
jgi:hypothetical protein